MNNLKREKSNSRGITLVALAITIVTIIIIATISITLIINSGIVNKAQSSADMYNEQGKMQQIKFAVLSAKMKTNGTITTENLTKELKKYLEDDSITVNKVGNKWYYDEYVIDSKGTVEKNNNSLPQEYQKVEYIESTETQWIDTGYIFKGEKCKIDADFVITKFTNGWTTISATQVDSSTRFGGIQFLKTTNYCTAGNKTADTGINVGDTIQNTRYQIIYDLDMQANTLTVKRSDNVNKSMAVGGSANTNLNIYIFAKNKNSTVEEYSNVKLYKYSIEENGVKVRELIPCYSVTTVTNADGNTCVSGTIGMYDLVNKKFYTNKGTGTFLKGNDI